MHPAFPFAITVPAWTGDVAQTGISRFQLKERAGSDAALDGSTDVAAFADNFRQPASMVASKARALACEQMP